MHTHAHQVAPSTTTRRFTLGIIVILLVALFQAAMSTLSAAHAEVVASANAVAIASPAGVNGYTLLDANGNIYNFGTAYLGGSPQGAALPFVGLAYTPTGKGYALLDSAGHVYNYGDSQYNGGSPAGAALPFRSISYKPGTSGYTLLDSVGHIYNYGTAYLGGAPAGATLPFRAISYTPSGLGYTLMDSAGSIYNYGDSQYNGGTPTGSARPMTGLAYKPGTFGYTELDSVGHIYNYGTGYLGGSPTGATSLIGMVYTPSGNGYTLADTAGHIYNYGDSQYLGGFDRVGAPAGTPSGTAAQFAQQILNLKAAGKIRIADYSEQPSKDSADRSLASQQLQDIAAGKPAHLSTRCFSAGQTPPPVQPDVQELKFLADLGQQSNYILNTLFGQCHTSSASLHYKGKAADFACGLNTGTADNVGAKYGVKHNFETCSANGHWHYSVGGN